MTTLPMSAAASSTPHIPATDSPPTQSLRYLKAEEYRTWDSLVDASPQGTVLCRSWMLDAFPGDIRVLGFFRGNRLVAGMPLCFEKRWGMTLCRMPKLVHTWGVVMEPPEGKRVTALSREMEVLGAFAEFLAQQRFFIQSFHPSMLNWLPFFWNGFRQVTRFGYVFEDLSDTRRIWDEMEGNVRKNIRKAEKNGITIVPCDSDLVASTAEKTFVKQRRNLPYSASYLKDIYSAACRNNSGACFAAVDQHKRTHATIFLLWDRKRAYYIAGGTDPELRSSGADSLLIWHALQFCSERSRTFDFAGSVVEGIEKFFRGFGAALVPYNYISKVPLPLLAYFHYRGSSHSSTSSDPTPAEVTTLR